MMKKVKKDIILKLMFNIQKSYMNFMGTYQFYVKEKIKKVEKHVTNLCDKTEYVLQIRNLKGALNHGLILKKYIEQYSLIKMLS